MRYLKLYFQYVKRSFISRMEYKKDTFVALFGFFIENAASIACLYCIISSIPSLQGWTIYQLGFLYGFQMLPRGLDHLLTDDLWLVAYRKVRSGELDQYYLRPLPVLFQVIAEKFNTDALGELIVGACMLIACGIASNIPVSFGLVFLCIIATIFGALLITSIKILFSSLAFIFKTSGPILQVAYNFMDYCRYPIGIFPKFIKILLLCIFPYAVIINLPVEAIFFGNLNPYMLSLIIVSISVVFFVFSTLIWTMCARRYESTGN